MSFLYLSDPEAVELERLRSALDPRLALEVVAPENWAACLPRTADLDGIVGGLPPRDLLNAAARLRYLVIPYAGLPRRTRELLADFPRLTVLNSHYNAPYAAEHAWALLLAAAKRIVPASERLRRGDWRMRYEGPLSVPLAGKTLLLVGYGAIGRALLPMARGFGMRVGAVKRRPGSAPELDFLGTAADLPRFLPGADAVIVSLPGTGDSAELMDAAAFGRMKPGALFVNVGRGAAVAQSAFHQALAAGRIGAAGIDTWWRYPERADEQGRTAPADCDFSDFENLVFSPHRASHCVGREEARMADLAAILNSVAAGEPLNVVDPLIGY